MRKILIKEFLTIEIKHSSHLHFQEKVVIETLRFKKKPTILTAAALKCICDEHSSKKWKSISLYFVTLTKKTQDDCKIGAHALRLF